MTQDQINNLSYLRDKRKQLRNNLTPAEAILWRALKGGVLRNRKFRRQHSIENYILDFYRPSEQLAVELDGQVHYDPIQSFYDEERTKRLAEPGITVVRFENKLVFDDMPGVLREIESYFWKARYLGWLAAPKTSSTTSPFGYSS